jgi:hypothetical protein
LSVFSVAAGAALVLATAIIVLPRFTTTFDGFRGSAASEVGRNEEGGALAAADMSDLDNDFVRNAIHMLPPNAQFAVVIPHDPLGAQATYGVSTTTIYSVAPLMQEVLLPRREVSTAEKGTYVLCFLCDTTSLDHRTHWLWKGTQGDLIGLVYR